MSDSSSWGGADLHIVNSLPKMCLFQALMGEFSARCLCICVRNGKFVVGLQIGICISVVEVSQFPQWRACTLVNFKMYEGFP